MDPFMGSGTTMFAAQELRRNAIGIEILEEYYKMVKQAIEPVPMQLYLLDKEEVYGELVN
jgi:DNA modification methylase